MLSCCFIIPHVDQSHLQAFVVYFWIGNTVLYVSDAAAAAAPCRKFTDNDKVSGASEEMHPLKELAEPEQVGAASRQIATSQDSPKHVPVKVSDGHLQRT